MVVCITGVQIMLVIQLLLGKYIYTYNRSLNFTISSWLRDKNGLIVRRRINAHDRLKPVLQFVAIQRRDTKQWALPGVRFQNK